MQQLKTVSWTFCLWTNLLKPVCSMKKVQSYTRKLQSVRGCLLIISIRERIIENDYSTLRKRPEKNLCFCFLAKSPEVSQQFSIPNKRRSSFQKQKKKTKKRKKKTKTFSRSSQWEVLSKISVQQILEKNTELALKKCF